MTDPRGWEALTQAEGDADVRAEMLGEIRRLEEKLSEQRHRKVKAERERDEAREALREAMRHHDQRAYCNCGVNDMERAWRARARDALAGGPQT